MRPVNLIPPEDRRGDLAPLRAGVASYAIVAVLAVALIGVVMVILTNNQISDSKAELAGLEARKAQADLAAADLAAYGDFASLEQARSLTVSSLAQSRFDWERVLNELALVIPDRVELESLTGTATSGVSLEAGSSGTSDASITGPSLLIGGCADGQKGVARFLAALKDIDGVTRVGMQTSELGDESSSAASAATGGTEGSSSTCQTRPEIARFQITVAFDAVPAPVSAAAPSTATPAAAGTTTTPESGTATTTPESGTATTPEQQAAIDSAEQQTSEAKGAAETVGVGN